MFEKTFKLAWREGTLRGEGVDPSPWSCEPSKSFWGMNYVGCIEKFLAWHRLWTALNEKLVSLWMLCFACVFWFCFQKSYYRALSSPVCDCLWLQKRDLADGDQDRQQWLAAMLRGMLFVTRYAFHCGWYLVRHDKEWINFKWSERLIMIKHFPCKSKWVQGEGTAQLHFPHWTWSLGLPSRLHEVLHTACQSWIFPVGWIILTTQLLAWFLTETRIKG